MAALADTLATAELITPLAPDQQAHLSIPMPAGFAPDQEVWIAYELIALAPNQDDGEVGLEQAFERVMVPGAAMFASFHAGKMDSHESAGGIPQRLEAIAGHRDPAELKRMMGEDLYAAYTAVNDGTGRVLTGRLLRRLPAPGTSDAPLLVSVTRASGMQPLALMVLVGQGDLPLEYRQKPQDSLAYRLGYIVGIMLFGWLVLRIFRRKDGQVADRHARRSGR